MRLHNEQKVYVAGHRGLVGSALMRRLAQGGYERIVTRTHAELDLCDQTSTLKFLKDEKPDVIIVAAAKVGGIQANNTFRADFIYENLAIANNVIHGAHEADVSNLLFLGSSCIYPKLAPQPMKEDHLLTGALEPTNEPYAIAKIAGLKLCEAYHSQYERNYFSVMPTNLYGIGDNFDLQNSHVLPALLRKFHEAKMRGDSEVVMWGTGTPRREFLFADDLRRLHPSTRKRKMQPRLEISISTSVSVRISQSANSQSSLKRSLGMKVLLFKISQSLMGLLVNY